ncbi:MAG: hypothetical protein ACFFCZ_30285 [Promethearchaeota archaeon]
MFTNDHTEDIEDLDKRLLNALCEVFPEGVTIDDLMEKLGRKTLQCQERIASMLTFLYTQNRIERKPSQRGFLWSFSPCVKKTKAVEECL